MKAIIERILSTGGSLFEERGGRVLVNGTNVDLAVVWEIVRRANENRISTLHSALHNRDISLNLAAALTDFVLKHPVTVEDYSVKHRVFDAHHRTAETVALPMWDATAKEGKAETTVYRVPDGDLLDSTKPHWALDQSLQEARDHINILHKEIDDLKQHIANLQATVCVQLAQSLGVRGAVMEIIRGLAAAGGLSEERGEAAAREFDETIAGIYRSIEGHFDQPGKIFRPIAPIHPHLADVLSIEVRQMQKAGEE